MSLVNTILSKLGDEGISNIAQSVGLDNETTKKSLGDIAPLLTGALAKNAEDENELGNISAALEKDHDGSIFDRIGDLVSSDVDTKGDKILSHILGGNTQKVVEATAKEEGVDTGTMGKLFEMAAPLVLGQLGSEKKSQGLDLGMLSGLLQGEKKEAESSNNMYMKMAGMFLDKDGDGDIKDDLLNMAVNKFFGGGKSS